MKAKHVKLKIANYTYRWTIKYAKLKKYDIANGEGVRVSLYVTGCNHHCKGCFNSEIWDFTSGEDFTKDTINEIITDLDKPYITGLTLLGGEPLEEVNQQGILPLLKKVKELLPNKTIWLYSGFTYEQIQKMPFKETNEILKIIDVLVDGKFEEDLFDANLYFRGSSNQRIIDIPKSIKENKIVLHEKNKKKELIKLWMLKI